MPGHSDHNRFGGHGADRPQKLDLTKLKKDVGSQFVKDMKGEQTQNRRVEDARILLNRIAELEKKITEKDAHIKRLEEVISKHAGFLAMHGMVPYKVTYICPECGETSVEETTESPESVESREWKCSKCSFSAPNEQAVIDKIKTKKLKEQRNAKQQS